jgi:hypothetical protein
MSTTLMTKWDDGEYTIHVVRGMFDLFWSLDRYGDPNGKKMYILKDGVTINILTERAKPEVYGGDVEWLPYFIFNEVEKVLDKEVPEAIRVWDFEEIFDEYPELIHKDDLPTDIDEDEEDY